MERSIRCNLLSLIETPKDVDPVDMRKTNKMAMVKSSSPVKHLSSLTINSGASECSSPTKYNRLKTLLSQIEENCEGDERSPLGSEFSSEESVSPTSSNKLCNSSGIEISYGNGAQQSYANSMLVNGSIKNSIYEFDLPTLPTKNSILDIRYNPFEQKNKRKEFQYSNFDEYFKANYQKFDSKSFDRTVQTAKNQQPKFVSSFSLMDEAENFLMKLGKELYNLRNLEADQNSPEDSSEEDPAPPNRPKRKLKFRVVKKSTKKRAIRRESKRLMNISSKLLEIENNLGNNDQKESRRKLTHDMVNPIPRVPRKKRSRFSTFSNQIDLAQQSMSTNSEKEISIKLDDDKPTSYAKSFKNYAFKTYEEEEGEGQGEDIEESDLKINLNPCLPVEPTFRKTSSNSQNVNQSNPLQAYDGGEQKETSFQKSLNKSRFYNFEPHKEAVSDCALKSKRQRLNTGSSTSNTSLTKGAGKRKKYYKKSRKTSISANEFNTFFNAFEQHHKLKVDCSMPTASGGQASLSSAKVSPSLKAFPFKEASKSSHSSKNYDFPTTHKNSVEGKAKIVTTSPMKMTQLIDSLVEIEKGLGEPNL